MSRPLRDYLIAAIARDGQRFDLIAGLLECSKISAAVAVCWLYDAGAGHIVRAARDQQDRDGGPDE